ncbi:type IV pilus biogenesis protein PilM [Escherichia coli]|nr:type IV pilus biogenesis protein PilM [Escherichia coli]
MGWFIVFIMVITTTGNFWFTSQLSRSEHRHQAAENTQQAATFIRYMNAINDYLHQHPERRTAGGRLTSAQLGIPGRIPSVISSASNVFCLGYRNPGLMAALREQSNDSALLGRVENGRLLDTAGRALSITLPSVIPDHVILWMN